MKIALLGDIALIGKYDLTKNAKAKQGLEKISNFLKSYDYVIGNLETPLTDRTRTLVPKSMHLKSPLKNIELLKYLNISAVSLANNHIYDYGRKAVEDTIKILRDNNIEYVGIDGRSITLDKIEINGYCCYSTNAFGYNNRDKKGVNTLTYNRILNQTEKDKNSNKLSLFSIHWGDEHTNYPRFDHLKLARELTEKNNIIINGHHPHVIQGVEKVNDSVIAYSQGNFCFDDCKAISGTGLELKQVEANRESFILEVEIEGNKIINYNNIGIKEINNEIILDSIKEKLNMISSKLKNISDIVRYQQERIMQIKNPEFRVKKFGEKNLKWYLKRLNYFPIGAYIFGKINKKRYNEVLSSYLN
ncbi:CapA family protein [Bacteroidota bacterium]